MVFGLFVLRQKLGAQWKRAFSNQSRVLDVGCGSRPWYHRYLRNPVCCDRAPSETTQVVCDSASLPFKAASFDGVACVNSLYFYAEPKKAIAEFSRVLRKNATLALVVPFMYPIHDAPYDKYRFTRYGVEEILKDEFSIVRMVPIGGIFSYPLLICHGAYKAVSGKNPMRKLFASVIFLLPCAFFEALSLLDALDFSQRSPVYYFCLAKKK